MKARPVSDGKHGRAMPRALVEGSYASDWYPLHEAIAVALLLAVVPLAVAVLENDDRLLLLET